MMSPAKEEKRRGHHRSLNVLVYGLAVLAVSLIAIAAWKRYWQRRRPGEGASEPGDAIERGVDTLASNLAVTGGWTQAAGLPQYTPPAPMCRFACRQCQSLCWMRSRRGCPACPFCGRVMARQGLRMSQVGGTGMGGAASPVAIRADAARPHGDRGACNICHSVARFVSLPSALNPAAAAQSVPKAVWQNVAAPFDRHAQGALRGLERAPAVASDALRPTLVREFGIEVCPAPGAGVKVTGVMGNSYASNAGLRAGDIVIECNGARVRGVEQFQQLVSRAAPEADAQIKILRDGRTRDLLIMVGEGEMEGFTPIQRP